MENISTPKPMDFSGNMAENWKKFSERFQLYLQASGANAKSDKTRIALLLHIMGEEAIDIFNSFTWENAGDKDKYKNVLEKFEKYFTPKKNVVLERFNFNRAKFESKESIDTFVTKLKNLSKSCEYGDLTGSLIRDKIVISITDTGLQERLLREADLTLDKCIQLCKTSELTKHHMQTLQEGAPEVAAVSKHKPNRRRSKKKPEAKEHEKTKSKQADAKPEKTSSKLVCRFCGTNHPPKKCPAYGKKCTKCGNSHHSANMCWNFEKKVHTVEQSDCEDSQSDSELWFNAVEIDTVSSEWICPITVNEAIIPAKLDTGAQANVLTEQDYRAIKGLTLKPASETLRGYTGDLLHVMGKCVANVRFGNKKLKSVFYVVKGTSQSLLGLDLCEKLGLITLNCDVEKSRLAFNSIAVVRKEDKGSSEYEWVYKEYKDVFQGLGCIPGEYHIETDPSVPPVVYPCRKVPFQLHDKFKEELERMEAMGVITKVEEPTDWVNAFVLAEKPNGKIRVCLDPRALNRAIKREHFKLPTREEVQSKFGNAKVFSKLDASTGFWQKKLDEESSYLTTFATPFGRYRYLRLPYGISSAPEVYHRSVKDMFGGIPNVDTSMDDIIIATEDAKTHLDTVKMVLDTARRNNLKLNKDKCLLGVNQLVFLGDLLTNDGVKPDPKKVSAIVNMPAPEDKTGVHRFLGMLNYVGKWIPELSQRSEPLRNLMKKDVHFEWNHEHQRCFNDLKSCFTTEPVLAFFKPGLPLKLSCDANKNGLGCCLLMYENQEWKPLGYFSRPMLSAETRYAQIEKELLAIAFGCARCHQYIYGAKVQVETDHKSLIPLFKKPLADCPLRVQKLLMRLQRYDLDVSYVPGKQLVLPDTLSRATENTKFSEDKDLVQDIKLYVDTVIRYLPFSDDRLTEVKDATSTDNELSYVMNLTLNGWPNTKEQCPPDALPYWNIREELSVADGIVTKGTKVVIPKALRPKMLKKIHEGHMGVVKSKQRAKDVLYWPNITSDIENMTKSCPSCVKFSSKHTNEPLRPHELPLRPFQKIGTDLFSYHGQNYLLVQDYYSNFPEVVTLKDMSTKSIIVGLKSIMSRHGLVDVLVSDNQTCYSSDEFKQFAIDWEFKHVTSSPHHAASNSRAENGVKIVKGIIKKSIDSGSDLFKDLLAYRTTPLPSTGMSPAHMLFNRRAKSTLPCHPALLTTANDQHVTETMSKERLKQAHYYNRNTKTLSELHPQDSVLLYNFRTGLWDTQGIILYEVSPRSFMIELESGLKLRRNRKHIKRSALQFQHHTPVNVSNNDNIVPQHAENPPGVEQTVQIRRSKRHIKPPCRFGFE